MLRTALGTVMIAAALALFDKAGIELPVAVLVGAPVALAAALAGAGARAPRAGRAGRILPGKL